VRITGDRGVMDTRHEGGCQVRSHERNNTYDALVWGEFAQPNRIREPTMRGYRIGQRASYQFRIVRLSQF
jgi:hypothetical protein